MDKTNIVGYVGTMALDPARALMHLSNLYANNYDALREYIENGLDAGSTEIIILIEPSRIVILDNGRGMVDKMFPWDAETLRNYKEDIAHKRSQPWDVRTILDPLSLGSLEWMIGNYASSSKIPRGGEIVRGMRGIGTAAFWQFANNAVFYTRPQVEIAIEYYKLLHAYYAELAKKTTDPKERIQLEAQAAIYFRLFTKPDLIPTFKATPPSWEALRAHNLEFPVEPLGQPVKDVLGREFKYGTIVEFSGIKVGGSIQPSTLVDCLARWFSDDLNTKRVKMTVLDKQTNRGQKARFGVELHVAGVQYRGVQAITQTFTLANGAPFEVDLWIDLKSKTGKPGLRRKRAVVRDLTDLDEFKHSPWNKVGGHIDYPDLGANDDDDVWVLNKGMPREGHIRREWVRILEEQVIPVINQRLDELEIASQNKKLVEMASDLASAVESAVSDIMPELEIGNNSVRQSRTSKKTRIAKRKPTRVRVSVFDENNQGVEDVKIILHPHAAGAKSMHLYTGLTGTASFGKFPTGRYRIAMVVPDGMKKDPETVLDYVFNIDQDDEDKKGHNAVFRVITGRDMKYKSRKRLPRVAFTFEILEDEARAYDAREIEFGTIAINQNHPTCRTAFEEKDDNLMTQHFSQCAAFAIVGYSCAGMPEDFIQAKWFALYASVYEKYRMVRTGKRVA